MLGKSDFPGQTRGLRSCLKSLENIALTNLSFFHAIKTPHKIQMPPGASELTVCYSLKSNLFLLRNELDNFRILNLGELLGRNFSLAKLFSRILDGLRTQKAADYIKSIWCCISRGSLNRYVTHG
ncbi:hypothetical protein D3C80_1439320 [compost metagenome]